MKRTFVLDEAEICHALYEYVHCRCGVEGKYSVSFVPSFFPDGHMEYKTAMVELRDVPIEEDL